MTVAKFAYSFKTTRYGCGAIAGFTGETAIPSGRVPRVCPAGRKSTQRVTRRSAVSTTATRQSG